MSRITKRSVDALAPSVEKTSGGNIKDAYLWDRGEGSISGFGCKCTATGKKVFLFQYRSPTGKTRRLTIGPYSETLTPDQARALAKSALLSVLSGKDPSELAQKRQSRLTVSQVRERFIQEHVREKLKARSQIEYERWLNNCIPSNVERMPIEEVKRSDISAIHHKMRATPIAANRSIAALSKMFAWAEDQELRSPGSNPCKLVKHFRERPRERFLSADELSRLGRALEDSKQNPLAIAAIRLLLFTGARRNEILTLRWSWIDFENGVARLPDSKTGAKSIHLSPPALNTLQSTPRFMESNFVFPATRGDSYFQGLQKAWRVIRQNAGLEDVRIHDLRHSFASVGAMGGASLPIIGALLGHSQPATTKRYSHLSASPLSAASDAIGNRLEAALGQTDGTKHIMNLKNNKAAT